MDGEQKTQRKLLLLIGILANVGLLGYYKYTDFFIENWNFLSGSDYALKHIVPADRYFLLHISADRVSGGFVSRRDEGI